MARIVVKQAVGKRRANLPAGVDESEESGRFLLAFEGGATVDRRWIRCTGLGQRPLKFNCGEVEQVTSDGAQIWPLPKQPITTKRPVPVSPRL